MDAQWRIELLGQLRLRRGDTISLPLQRQKSTALLAYLAFHTRHPHLRELLTELLWPEEDPEVSRPKLRSQLHLLRELLAGPESPAGALLIAERTTVHLDPAAFTTDVREFCAALRSAAGAADLHKRIEWLAAAVALYGGELLPGHYEPWVVTERQALAEQYMGALRQLAAAREEAGDLQGALAAARQAVSSDPLQEEAHYDVMRLSAALGQPSAALRQYQELERLLREELDETPSAEARALAEELRDSARTLVVARRLRPAEAPSLPLGTAPPSILPPPSPRDPAAPPPRTPAAPRLPVQLTRFFGREAEITRLTETLSSPIPRLVTVTGPGGSGKTRLAIAVAGRLQERFGDAIGFVPLAALADATRIPDAVAAALGLARSAEVEPIEHVIEHLATSPWLLVLDNYEHLVEEGAPLVRRLLERIPTLTCLVTSRQRLGLAGEQEFALLPLPTPRRSARLEQLSEYASVQLFVDRAQAARVDFALTEANAAAVGELCDRLEGLPLAVELAAARAAVLTPEQMLAQMEKRFAFLVSRQRDVPARHRTLRAAIESSYQLLTPELRQFFARLSVFRGGWTLEAAQAVCVAAARAGRALDHLEQLHGYSLIGVEDRGGGDPRGGMRYRLLETLREYAWEQLAASGELAAVRTRHRDWFLHVARQSVAAANGPEQRVWLNRLETEIDNLRAALAWCQEEADADPDGDAAAAGLRLADALFWFWVRRGYITEGLQWLEGALARGPELPAALRASAFYGAASLAGKRRTWEEYLTLLQAARDEYQKVLTLVRTEANRPEVVRTLQALADIAVRQADWDAAWAFCLEARPLIEELGDRVGLARTLEVMAGIRLGRGEFQTARALLEEHLAICRELGNPDLLIHALGGMGHVERGEGQYARARALYQESLELRRNLGYQIAVAQSLEDLAVLAGREGQMERASRLLGAAEAFCETLGARLPVAVAAEYERTVAEGRAALGEAAFAAAWAEGRLLSLEQAITYALETSEASLGEVE